MAKIPVNHPIINTHSSTDDGKISHRATSSSTYRNKTIMEIKMVIMAKRVATS